MNWLDILRKIFSNSSSQELINLKNKNSILENNLSECLLEKKEITTNLKKSLSKIESLQELVDKLKENEEHLSLQILELGKENNNVNLKIIEKETEIKILEDQVSILQLQINNAIFIITPEILKTTLKKQLPYITNKQQTWWDYEKTLWIVFAKPEIQDYEEISAEEIKNRILAINPNLVLHSSAKDGKYRIITIAQATEIILNSFIPLKKWLEEIFDCDDFAEELRLHFSKYTINSCLEIWGYWGNVYHERNWMVCKDGVIEIEPQTGQIGVLPLGVNDNFKGDSLHDW